MRRPSLSAVALLSVAMLAGSGFAALRHANETLSAAAFLADGFIFALATVGALCRPRDRRAGWAGFAVFGWGYMTLAFGPWPPGSLPDSLWARPQIDPLRRLPEVRKPRLDSPRSLPVGRGLLGAATGFRSIPAAAPRSTSKAADVAGPGMLLAQLSGPMPQLPDGTYWSGWGPRGVRPIHHEESRLVFGHCLWALLAACVGGVASHIIFSRAPTVRKVEPRPQTPADHRSRRRGLTVLKLMGLVVLAALGLTALRNASAALAGVIFLATYGLLGVALLGAFAMPAGRRLPWAAVALFGWGYLRLAFARTYDFDNRPIIGDPALATTMLIESLYANVPYVRDGHSHDASYLSRRVLHKLEEPIPIPFKQPTRLADALDYIRRATDGPDMPGGVPIWVDPDGLQMQDKTMDSTVVLELHGVPLRRSLKILLDQIDFRYYVKDGYITMTSKVDDGYDPPGGYDAFQRIGHCLFALVAGGLGGLAGLVLMAWREKTGA